MAKYRLLPRGAALVLFVAAAATVTAGPTATPSEDLDGRWSGWTNALGYSTFVDLDLRSGSGGSMMFYGAAPMGFDFPVNRAVATVTRASDTLLVLEVQGRSGTAVWTGTLSGNTILGTIASDVGTEERSFAFRKTQSLEEAAIESLVGVYEFSDHRLAVTWREYGDLRAIRLDTGAGLTLVPTTSHEFIAAPGLDGQRPPSAAELAPPEAFRFVEQDGEIGLLRHIDSGGVQHEGRRVDSFRQSQLQFSNGDIELRGTLLRPAGGDRHPGVVLVHGSGPIYRTALFERAAKFAEMGLAVLIYDKRGTGESTGNWQAGFTELAADASAAIDRLVREPLIDADRVGLQGHSQAGFVIPVAAASNPAIRFAAVVSGGAINPAEQSLYDKQNDLIEAGFNPAEVDEALALMRRVFDYARYKTGDHETLQRDYLSAKGAPWFETTDLPDVPAIPTWDDPPAELVAWHEELSFEPGAYMEKLSIPFLLVFGAEDKTVPPHRTAEASRTALGHNGAAPVDVEMIPGADHAIRISNAEGVRVLAPQYMAAHRRWFHDHLGLFATVR